MKYPNLSLPPFICIDVETNGLKWWEDEIFGVALSIPTISGKMDSYYWDIRKEPEALKYLQDNVPKARMVVNHNIKFEKIL